MWNDAMLEFYTWMFSNRQPIACGVTHICVLWMVTETPNIVYKLIKKKLFQQLRRKLSNADGKRSIWSEEEFYSYFCSLKSSFRKKLSLQQIIWGCTMLLSNPCHCSTNIQKRMLTQGLGISNWNVSLWLPRINGTKMKNVTLVIK